MITSPTERPAGSRPRGLLRAGLIVFAIGLAAIAWTFADFAMDEHNRPLWQNLLCVLAPVGLAMALVALVRDARADNARGALVDGARVDHSPAVVVPAPGRSERIFAWTAAAEGVSWLLLIVATVVKYTQGSQLAVHILGPVHGALFTAYVVLALVVARRRRWSVWTLAIVLIDSFLPGGGLLVARRNDLKTPAPTR